MSYYAKYNGRPVCVTSTTLRLDGANTAEVWFLDNDACVTAPLSMIKKVELMTGKEALFQFLVHKKPVRRFGWDTGRFLSYYKTNDSESIKEIRNSFVALVTNNFNQYDWTKDDWEIYVQEDVPFADLFSKLQPGVHATSTSFPGKVFTLVKNEIMWHDSTMKPERPAVTRDLLKATFKVS